jgi:hypothetical protein
VVIPAWVTADDPRDIVLAAGEGGLHVAPQKRREGFRRRPLRMERRERPDPVDREQELEIRRLLGPQRSVVVEHRDAVGRRDISRGPLGGDPLDEVHDRRPRGAVVPGGERIALGAGGAGRVEEDQPGESGAGEHCRPWCHADVPRLHDRATAVPVRSRPDGPW